MTSPQCHTIRALLGKKNRVVLETFFYRNRISKREQGGGNNWRAPKKRYFKPYFSDIFSVVCFLKKVYTF